MPAPVRWRIAPLLLLFLAACDSAPADPEDAAAADRGPTTDAGSDSGAGRLDGGGGDAAPDADPAADADPTDAAPDAQPPDAQPSDAEIPPAARVRLNEIDCHGRDFIEVINLEATPVDLRGWRVTDALAEADSGTLLDGLVLPPGGIDAIRRQTPDEAGFTFGVACATDTITLIDPAGAIADAVTLPALPAVYTWGRLPDGQGDWTRTGSTRAAPNARFVDPADDLFDPARVFTLDFEAPPASIEAIEADPYEYAAATLSYDGGPPQPVGLRLKGRAGSFRTLDRKSAFKVSLDWSVPDARLLGLRRLTLNNMVQDNSMLHEWTAYTLFRAMGVAAPRVGYARVRLNGEDYGLYSHVETPENEMLDRWFTSTAALYEGAYGTDLFPDHVDSFDRDEGDDDREALISLATLMQQTEPADFYAATADRIDWPQVLATMVTEIYIGHWDGYAPTRNNYFLHFDDDGVMRLMPWGTDQTFADHLPLREGQGLLLDRCRAAPACMDAFDATLARLVAVVDAQDLAPRIELLALSLRPAVEADSRRSYDVPSVERAVAETIEFLARRRAEIGALTECISAADRDPDGDGFVCDRDCDPNDGTIWPGAPEICGDGIDQDCNGLADDAPECPDCTEFLRDGHRYLVCTTPRSYADSRDRCREHGAEMWIADGEAESDWVVAQAIGLRWQDYWIGLDDIAVEDRFVWADGIARPWTNWNDGEPNNAGEEDCTELRADSGRWNDLPCDIRRAVICEDQCNPATDLDRDGANGCGMDCDDNDPIRTPGARDLCNDGIDQDCSGEVDDGPGCVRCAPLDYGAHRYLICDSRLDYTDARDACRALQMDLAVLADGVEAARIGAAARAMRPMEYWVGLDDRAREGTFRWIDGREAGVGTPWSGGEPNDYGDGEDCAHLLADRSALNDIGCDSTRGFICEMTCGPGSDRDRDGVPRCDGDCDDDDRAIGRCP